MIIAVTPGDPDGIGPEIVWKSLKSRKASGSKTARILCICAKAPFQKHKAPIFEIAETQVGHKFDRVH
jgi:4-hydroxy-L-threonine phosphate dehydrogenase PdxA